MKRYIGIIKTLLFTALDYLIASEKKLLRILNCIIKVIMDYGLTLVGTIIISPVLIFIAIWIYKDSPGPVIFKHIRVGRNGKPFPCYKLRTMYIKADEMLEDLLAKDPDIKLEWERDFKLKNDPRITRSGALLRKTSLDELPQLFNVLRGEMSLVGPRPVTQEELDKFYGDAAELYCSVKPGITGLWQVSGRSDTTYEERVQMDCWYVRNNNILLDIMLLLRTVSAVISKRGSY